MGRSINYQSSSSTDITGNFQDIDLIMNRHLHRKRTFPAEDLSLKIVLHRS